MSSLPPLIQKVIPEGLPVILDSHRSKGRAPPFCISLTPQGPPGQYGTRLQPLRFARPLTFSKFYQFHTMASADASLGRNVLQAAVQ